MDTAIMGAQLWLFQSSYTVLSLCMSSNMFIQVLNFYQSKDLKYRCVLSIIFLHHLPSFVIFSQLFKSSKTQKSAAFSLRSFVEGVLLFSFPYQHPKINPPVRHVQAGKGPFYWLLVSRLIKSFWSLLFALILHWRAVLAIFGHL